MPPPKPIIITPSSDTAFRSAHEINTEKIFLTASPVAPIARQWHRIPAPQSDRSSRSEVFPAESDHLSSKSAWQSVGLACQVGCTASQALRIGAGARARLWRIDFTNRCVRCVESLPMNYC
jgi:hypothetical protein